MTGRLERFVNTTLKWFRQSSAILVFLTAAIIVLLSQAEPIPILSAHPTSSEKQLIQQGITYFQQKQYDHAVQSFTQAIAEEQGNDQVFLLRARAYVALKQNDEALVDIAEAVRLRQDNPEAYWLRGILYERMGRNSEAIGDLNAGIALSPQGSLARRLYATRGSVLLTMSEFEKAISDLNKALELGDTTDWTYFRRGRAFMELGRYKEAIQDFTKALERNRDHYDSRLERAWVFGCVRKFDKSIQDLSHLVTKDPTDLVARSLRGWAYANSDEFQPALNDLNYAAEHGAQDPWLYLDLSTIYYRTGGFDKAIQANARVFEFGDERVLPAAYLQRALLFLVTGRVGEAKESYERGSHLSQEAFNRESIQNAITGLQNAMKLDKKLKETASDILGMLEESLAKIPPKAHPPTGVCRAERRGKSAESRQGLTVMPSPSP